MFEQMCMSDCCFVAGNDSFVNNHFCYLNQFLLGMNLLSGTSRELLDVFAYIKCFLVDHCKMLKILKYKISIPTWSLK